jgi:hypothetical protein
MTTVSQAVALKFSWWLVGGRSSFGRQLVTLFYFGGPFLLIFAVLLLFALGVVQFTFPDVFESLKDMIVRGGRDDGGEFYRLLVTVISSDRAPAFLLAMMSLLLPLTVPWVWVYAGWGAYRELNAVSKSCSFFAGIIYVVLVIIILLFFIFVARVIV